MFIIIFKVILLAAAIKLHTIKREPLYSAMLYSVPLTITALIMGTPLFNLLIGSGILLALAFGYFWLLGSVPNGKPYYTVMAIGALLLFFVL